MTQQHDEYQLVPYPPARRWMAAAFRSVQHRPTMYGLIELDVTGARARLGEHKAATGESLSFTAFLTTCLARAVDEHKTVQACRKGSKHLVIFDDVDVWTMIEHDTAGQRRVFPTIIRAANRKTLRQIHDEIRVAQVEDMAGAAKRMGSLPTFLIGPFFLIFSFIGRRRPQVWKKNVGTVGITAVGMFGNGAGWGIPIPAPVLMLTVGGIGEKPAGVDGRIAMREFLNLTISFDHDILDGAPAARFTGRLKELIEGGYGLGDATIESERPVAEAASKRQEVDQ